MKKILVFAFALTLSAALYAQTKKAAVVPASATAAKVVAAPVMPHNENYSFSKINEIEIDSLGGSITASVSTDKTTKVTVQMEDASGCQPVVKTKNKELSIKMKKLSSSASCKAAINIAAPAKTKLDIEAMGATIEIGAFTKELSLDVRNSMVTINGFNGDLDIENIGSTITATGFFKPLEIETMQGVNHITWTKKGSYKIEIEGTGEIIFTFPAEVTKVPVKNNFSGNFMIKN
ncbi:hypothetical protein Dip510_000476 [Elusimicrobium posterum]|uniref:hypothetical protein n=1 Tax=Elusimicrobium posterum TaxID=3116653 RepID=UPI003C78724A